MSGTHTSLSDYFAAAMDRLGPFEPNPALAVAVSGGADSMGLAVLARDWVDLSAGQCELWSLITDCEPHRRMKLRSPWSVWSVLA